MAHTQQCSSRVRKRRGKRSREQGLYCGQHTLTHTQKANIHSGNPMPCGAATNA